MRESDARRRRRSLLATARLLLVVRLEVRAALPRSRGCKLGADGSISVYAASPRVRHPAAKQVTGAAAKQKGFPMPPERASRSERGSNRAPNARRHRSAERAAKHAQGRVHPAATQESSSLPPKRASRSEQGSERAPNARTRRSAARAAKHAQGRVQAEDRLRQLAGKMAKVQRWRASQEVWTAHMRDRASDGTPLSAPTSPSQPAAAPPAPASPPRPAFMGFFRAPRISEVDVSMLPESRGSKRDALARTPPPPPPPERPPPAESRKKTRGTGALQAALAAAAPPAAAPQPLTASSALWFDSIDGSMRQFDAGVPRPCRRHTTSRKAKPG
jgi:hypothetical protein